MTDAQPFAARLARGDTLASRIQGSFQDSMNGKAPPQDDEIMTALPICFLARQEGAYWQHRCEVAATRNSRSLRSRLIAREAGRSAPKIVRCVTALTARVSALAIIRYSLRGSKSFNWGAGMHQLGNASGFIQANISLGKGGTLSEQDAWDVAMLRRTRVLLSR